ncbi:hypothetical protein PENVUL_c012G08578 [Penicillium vulpinum]|uniref:Fungal-type protein kinase domain-containing protein n=1 Tax=Penicillium vulpinum TaxID=29845 RepID=A0A1V6S0W9_9EURO|nr:hypothetical protein PENVUL_c012G08578 [Penicillium vulpinum]
MEPAVVQLARPLTSLARNGGTQHASIHNDRVALTYMQHWSSFLQETRTFFLSVHITHQVPIKDESEIYVVGSELGLSGRFVRNLCDPVMQALMPLDQMSSVRFADIQALTPSGRTVPDVTFGLVNPSFPRSTTGLYMVGEFETPWTVDVDEMRINCPNPAPRLETLIGQVVGQMRMARVRYAFLTTYDFTVFVKRANDFSFLLSEPFGYDSQSPPLREMFVGFCLMAMADPKYSESHPDIETRLRGAPAPRVSHRVNNHHPRELPPLSTPRPITSTSVVVECGADMPVVADCVQQVSLSDSPDKAVWLADIRGTRRVLKCWSFEVDSL